MNKSVRKRVEKLNKIESALKKVGDVLDTQCETLSDHSKATDAFGGSIESDISITFGASR